MPSRQVVVRRLVEARRRGAIDDHRRRASAGRRRSSGGTGRRRRRTAARRSWARPCRSRSSLPQSHEPVARDADVEQRDPAARAHRPVPARRRSAGSSTRLRSANPHVTPSTERSRHGQAQDVGLHTRRAGPVGGEHPEATGRPRSADGRPCAGRCTGRPCPTRDRAPSSPAGKLERAHRPPPPPHVEPERHDAIDEVVPRRDGVEHLADRLLLLLALGRVSRSHDCRLGAIGIDREASHAARARRRSGVPHSPHDRFLVPARGRRGAPQGPRLHGQAGAAGMGGDRPGRPVEARRMHRQAAQGGPRGVAAVAAAHAARVGRDGARPDGDGRRVGRGRQGRRSGRSCSTPRRPTRATSTRCCTGRPTSRRRSTSARCARARPARASR